MIELTDEERVYVGHHALASGRKALRIIDAHAADRAALVAQLEEAERDRDVVYSDNIRASQQVAELTRERDEARAENKLALDDAIAMRLSAESEVTRLTEALAAANAEVIRLTAALAAAVSVSDARAEKVARLTEALAAAEQKAGDIELMVRGTISGLMAQREAAEARVHELEAQVERQRATIQAECKASSEHYERATVAEARVRELTEARTRANALLRDLTDCRDFGEFLNEHLPRIERFLSGTSDTIPRI